MLSNTVDILHDPRFFVKCENKKNSKKFSPFYAAKQKIVFKNNKKHQFTNFSDKYIMNV
ncbi:hypothetical protein I656_02938 [Geobacillus sp. WSUCF1]|nr:hypothetical protein I656_02938 [Geobacillus sp. WSUCF1]